MKPKPDYKKLYEAAQDGCNRLRIERDAAERRYQEMVVKAEMPNKLLQEVAQERENMRRQRDNVQAQLNMRPTIEKIDEKEVLPWWATWMLCIIMILSSFGYFECAIKIHKLQTPIKEPYPVQVEWSRNDTLKQLFDCQAHDKAATDAWRADEKTIRKLEREKP